jgi:hypothetical protein
MTDQNTITRQDHIIQDLRDQVEYYQGLEERENCYRCHVKEVEFPRRIKSVGDQIRANTIKDIMNTLARNLNDPDEAIALITQYYGEKC